MSAAFAYFSAVFSAFFSSSSPNNDGLSLQNFAVEMNIGYREKRKSSLFFLRNHKKFWKKDNSVIKFTAWHMTARSGLKGNSVFY
jgi:hypothetical protein